MVSYNDVEMEVIDVIGVNCKVVSDIWYRIMNLREECFDKPYNNENVLEATYVCACYKSFKSNRNGVRIPKTIQEALERRSLKVNPTNAIYLPAKFGFFEGVKCIVEAEFKRVNNL